MATSAAIRESCVIRPASITVARKAERTARRRDIEQSSSSPSSALRLIANRLQCDRGWYIRRAQFPDSAGIRQQIRHRLDGRPFSCGWHFLQGFVEDLQSFSDCHIIQFQLVDDGPPEEIPHFLVAWGRFNHPKSIQRQNHMPQHPLRDVGIDGIGSDQHVVVISSRDFHPSF